MYQKDPSSFRRIAAEYTVKYATTNTYCEYYNDFDEMNENSENIDTVNKSPEKQKETKQKLDREGI